MPTCFLRMCILAFYRQLVNNFRLCVFYHLHFLSIAFVFWTCIVQSNYQNKTKEKTPCMIFWSSPPFFWISALTHTPALLYLSFFSNFFLVIAFDQDRWWQVEKYWVTARWLMSLSVGFLSCWKLKTWKTCW